MRDFTMLELVIEGEHVFHVTRLPLAPFQGGVNQRLLIPVKLRPFLSVHDFLHKYLSGMRQLSRIERALSAEEGITPEMLCLVDPTEWIGLVEGFGEACALALFDAIRKY
jgi:hypothetical protein